MWNQKVDAVPVSVGISNKNEAITTHVCHGSHLVVLSHLLSMQYGRTALGVAAAYGQSSTVEVLLERGARIEHQDKVMVEGARPLRARMRASVRARVVARARTRARASVKVRVRVIVRVRVRIRASVRVR